MSYGKTRAGIVLTAEDNTTGAFASVRRNLTGLQQQAAGVGDSVGSLAGKFGTIGAALTAAFAGASLKGAIDLGDRLDDLSEKSGIAVKELSALRYAGEVTGTPLEALAGGIKKLAINMAEAAGGAKEQGKVFQALGINVKEMDGSLKGTDKVLGELADKFASFRDGPEKAALAVKVFGKAGADMIPLLNQGSAGIRDLREEGERLGAVIGDDFARQSAAFNDNMRKIELSTDGVKRSIAQELLPTLNTLAEAFLDSQNGSNSFAEIFGGSVRTHLQAVSILIANVSFVLKAMGREIGAIAAQSVTLATLDIKGFNAISKAVTEDAVRARKELDDLERRILQTGTSLAGAGRGIAADPRILGTVGSIREQAAAFKGNAPVIKDDASVSKAISEYDRLSKSIRERIALMDQELTVGRALTEQEKFEIKVLEEVAAAKGKISAIQITGIKAALEESRVKAAALQDQRKSLEYEKEQAQVRAELHAQTLRQALEYEKTVAALGESNKGLKEEIDLIGLSAEQQARYAIAKNNSAIAIKEEQLARMAGAETMTREQIALEEEIRLLRERNELLGRKVERTKVAEGIKETEAEWKRTTDAINQSLTDALLRGFESGKDFAKNLRDTLKNMFNTLVLRPIISAVMSPISGTINGAMNGMMGGMGGSAAGSMVGNMFSAGSGTALFQGLTGSMSMANVGGSIAANAASMVGATDGISALLATNGAYGTAAGGAMSGLATAIPYVGLLIAIGSLIHSMTQGETRGGGQYGYSFDGASVLNPRRGTSVSASGVGATFLEGPSDGDPNSQAVKKVVNSTVATIQGLLSDLGTGLQLTQFQAGYESSGKGRGGVFSGGVLSNGVRFGESGQGDNYAGTLFEGTSSTSGDLQAMLQAFASDSKQVIVQAIQALTDQIPATLSAMVQGIDAEGLSDSDADALVQKILGTVAAVKQFRQAVDLWPVEQLRGLSFDVSSALVEMMGGAQNALTQVGTYIDNFYSEQERRSQTTRNIASTLSAAGLSATEASVAGMTRAQFRALVEAQDLTTEAGQRSYAALMNVAGAFASLTPLVDAISDAMRGLQAETSNLEVELLRAQGNTAGAAALQRTLDTAGFTDAEIALYDYNNGLREQIAALNTAKATLGDYIGRLVASDKSLASAHREAAANAKRLFGEIAATNLSNSVAKAQQALEQAQGAAVQEQNRELIQTIDSLRGFARGLKELREELDGGPQGGLFGATKYQAARDALSGATAQNADELVKRFLDAAKDQAASSLDYRRDVAAAKGVLQSLEGSLQQQASTAQSQFNAELAAAQAAKGREMFAAEAKLQLAQLNQSSFGADQDTRGMLYGDLISNLYSQSGMIKEEFERWAWEMLNLSVTLPSYAVGTPYVPQDGPAYLHRGEAVIPAAFNVARQSSDNGAEVASLLRDVRSQLAAIASHANRTANATDKTQKTIQSVATGEQEFATRAAA